MSDGRAGHEAAAGAAERIAGPNNHAWAIPRRWRTCLLGGLLAVSALSLVRVPQAEVAAPLPAARSSLAVASESKEAAQAARNVMQRGGTAADAAIVAALVAGVAAPTSSGIGGGGFVVGWDADKQKPYVLDFRESAPQGLDREPFEQRPLGRDQMGHLVGVPGEVRGLYALHQRAGKLPWSELVAIAERHAVQGYVVSRHLASMLAWAQGQLTKVPGFGALYYPNGRPAIVGMRLTNPALGRTLGRIANEGPSAFYSGAVAEDIVATVREHGGTMTLADLDDYQVEWREPLRARYAGRDVFTMPPPSAGGLMLVQLLRLFPAATLKQLGHGTPAYQHMLAEGMRAAVADRARYLGDPDYASFDLQALVSAQRMDARRGMLSTHRSHALPRFGTLERGTHALVTKDRSGNAISLTTTVNHLFGAKLHAQDSGVVLNNELDDFSSRADVAAYGLEDTPNRARPGARPVSSMTPTLAVQKTEDGKRSEVVLALGGSGGTAIATNVAQVFLGATVFDQSAQRAVSADRIYIPSSGFPFMMVEKGTDEAHVEDLRWRGEIVGEMPFSSTAVQLIKEGEERAEAAADPRKHGSSFAY